MVLKEPKLQSIFGYKDMRDNVDKALDGTGSSKEGAVAEEKSCDEQIVINHNGTYIAIWRAFISFLMIFSSITYAYFAGFRASSRHEILAMNSMEILFFIDFCVNCITSYPLSPQPNSVPVTDLTKIRQRYYDTTFWRDVIPLIPLQLASFDTFKEDLFWSVKTMRVLRGFEAINVTKWYEWIKK
jgi:hypothetical protein